MIITIRSLGWVVEIPSLVRILGRGSLLPVRIIVVNLRIGRLRHVRICPVLSTLTLPAEPAADPEEPQRLHSPSTGLLPPNAPLSPMLFRGLGRAEAAGAEGYAAVAAHHEPAGALLDGEEEKGDQEDDQAEGDQNPEQADQDHGRDPDFCLTAGPALLADPGAAEDGPGDLASEEEHVEEDHAVIAEEVACLLTD